MKLKRILTALCLAIVCIVLGVACGKSGTLPKIEGSRKMADEEAVQIYEQLMEQTVEMDFKSIEGYVVQQDESFYNSYITECESKGYENEGTATINGVKITALSYPGQDGKACLIAYRDGEMYVIEFVYETQAQTKMEFVWFTDAEMALFHVNLTEPTGEVEGHAMVSNSKTDIGAFYDNLYLYITNKGKAQYNTFKQDLIRSGYTLGVMEESDVYSATLVKNGVEFRAQLYYDGAFVQLDICNETQRAGVDYGATLYDEFPVASVGIKYVSMEEYQDDKTGNKFGEVTKYTYFSYDGRYVVEFLGEEAITGDFFEAFCYQGGWISDFETRKEYGSNGTMLGDAESFRGGSWFTVKTHLYHRGFVDVSTYYHEARNLQKTGATRVIAGITCAEYKGEVSMNNNEDVWDATFYVWEEKKIPMSYTGDRWFDNDSEYTVEITYLNENSICEQVMNLENGSALKGYPEQLVQEKSKLTFDFSVAGADGYRYDRTQSETVEGVEVDYTAFDAYGVDFNEFVSYTQKLRGLGFDGDIYDSKCYVLYYALQSGNRIKIQVSYDQAEEMLTFYFVEEVFEGVNFASEGTLLVFKSENVWNVTKRGFVEFLGEDLHYGLYDGEEQNEQHYYAKRVGAYFDIYVANTEAELLGATPTRILVKELWSRVNGDLHFDVYCNYTKELDFVGTGWYATKDDDLPTLIYQNGAGEKIVLWDGYNIILETETQSKTELVFIEEEFEVRTPTIDAEITTLYSRWQMCADHREEFVDWKFNFYKNTYDTYQERHYENFTLGEYEQFYQGVNALVNGGWKVLSWGQNSQNETDKVYRSFNAIITDGNKRVAELYASYDASYENGQLVYSGGSAHVTEYDVATSVDGYFGNEFEEITYVDYSKVNGEYVYGMYGETNDPNGMEHPFMVENVGVDLNGAVCYGDWSGLIVFGAKTTCYDADRFGSKLVVVSSYEMPDLKSAKEYMASRLNGLSQDYDLSKFSFEGNETVAGITCWIYSGTYIYRGQTLELKVWQAEDGRNMRVKKQIEQRGPYKEYYTYEIISFTAGSFSALNSVDEISQKRLMNQKFSASEWKDEYYGFDFMPRVEGFTEFEFVRGGIKFYGEKMTLKAVPAGTFVEHSYNYTNTYIHRLNYLHVVDYCVVGHNPTTDGVYYDTFTYNQVINRLAPNT